MPVVGMYVCVCAQGVRGFYGGVSPALVGSVASWALYFFAYNEAKALMSTHAGATGTGAHMTSAAAAGVFVASVTNPIWLIKTRLQLQSRGPRRYAGALDCLIQTVRDEGVCGLYRGLVPSLLLVTHGAIQFGIYEQLRSWAIARNSRDGSDEDVQPSALSVSAMSMVSKATASLVTYPSQVIRARLQQQQQNPPSTMTSSSTSSSSSSPQQQPNRHHQNHRHTQHVHSQSSTSSPTRLYTNAVGAAATTLRHEGIFGLYKGFGVSMLRVLPQAAITFLAYENTLLALRHASSYL